MDQGELEYEAFVDKFKPQNYGIIPRILRKTAPPHSPTMVRGAGLFLRFLRCAAMLADTSQDVLSPRPQQGSWIEIMMFYIS